MVFGHGNFDSFELRSEDDEDVSTAHHLQETLHAQAVEVLPHQR